MSRAWWVARLNTPGVARCGRCQAGFDGASFVAFAGKYSRDAVWLCVPCAREQGLPLKISREATGSVHA